MTEAKHAPEKASDKSDIPVGSWIDQYVPKGMRGYAKLARLDRPIGTWLLLWPCLWAIVLAMPGGLRETPWTTMVLFAVGAMAMRGAGCNVRLTRMGDLSISSRSPA